MSDYKPPPSVRITATYPATDGTMPETVEVTYEVPTEPRQGEICAVILALCLAARRRSDGVTP